MNSHWLIVADGERTHLPDILRHIPRVDVLCACDGAYQWLQLQAVACDYVIGDFDSLSQPKDSTTTEQTTQWVHAPDQNATDLDKAIQFALLHGATAISLCSATGKRVDHSLLNLRLLKRHAHHGASLQIIRPDERIRYIETGMHQLAGKIGHGISIMGFDQATISTQGLKYNSKALTIGTQHDSSSNALAAQQANIQLNGQALFIAHPEVKFKSIIKPAHPAISL